MTNRIEKAIDIFLDAINKSTLAKGTCVACAVGQLIAHGMEGEVVKDELGSWSCINKNNEFIDTAFWSSLFYTTHATGQINRIDYSSNFDKREVARLEQYSNFSITELLAIEKAFELNTFIVFDKYYTTSKADIKADQIAGLAAVIEVMLGFDECKETVEEVFLNKVNITSAVYV